MSTVTPPRALVVRSGSADSRALLSTRYSVLAGADETGGALCLLEMEAPPAGAPPMHLHEHDGEGFVVLAGAMDVVVEGEATRLEPGDFAWVPPGVAHSFAPCPGGVRALVITAPAGFERFVRAAGVPCAGTGLPPEGPPPDPAAMAAMAARHGITVLGPPPAA